MKIAIIHNQFSRGGGMEAYMLMLIKGFLDAGDEVTIHTYEVDRQLAAQIPCSIQLTKVLPWPGRFQKYQFLHQCNADFDRTKYDISLSLTRTSCQDIAVCGGVHPEVVKRVKRSSLFRWLHDKIEIAFEKKMFTTVPIIMAHSKTIAKEIIDNYKVQSSKIKVLYPPIDTDKFVPSSPKTVKETCAEFNISPEKLTFLFPSCGHNRKGLQELIMAFNVLAPDRFELLVAGGKLPRKVPANIRHIGYIQNLAPIYSAVDYTILPSHYEPFGLVIPESLQCGTPVITTRGVGAAELVSEQDGILLDNNQPETIANAIKQLKKTPPAAPEHGPKQTPDESFADRHRLTITQHIADIKALYPALHSK